MRETTGRPAAARSGSRPSWPGSPRRAARKAAPSFARTPRYRNARPSHEPRPPGAHARRAGSSDREWRWPALPHRASARCARRGRRSECRARPSASVATIGFPEASASKAVNGVPSQRDGNTLRSNALRTAATSLANPTNTKRSPRPSWRACASSDSRRGPSPTRKKRARGCCVDDQVSGLDQVRVSLGLVQPRHCPDGEVIRADPKVLPGGRDLVGRARAAELIVRRAQVDDFHLGRLDEPCMDDEFGGALRDRDGDVGVALESAIGDLLKPGRVGQVRVLVQDRGDAAHGRRQSSERRRAVAVEVKDVDLLSGR